MEDGGKFPSSRFIVRQIVRILTPTIWFDICVFNKQIKHAFPY